MALTATSRLDVRTPSRFFKALGDDSRLRIVALLSHGELCVCHIEAALGLPQSTTSRQLGILKNAGIVEARRSGTWMYYRLAPQVDGLCRLQLQTLSAAFGKQRQLRADVERLLKSKGPETCR